MKVVVCLCLLLAAGNSFEWGKKREIEQTVIGDTRCSEGDPCGELFGPIGQVVNRPNFNLLVDDNGELIVNCSIFAMSEARACEYSCGSFEPKRLLSVWKYFCDNKDAVEDLDNCLNVVNVLSALRQCTKMFEESKLRTEVPPCLVTQVATQEQCNRDGGRLISQVFQDLFM